jgi:RNA polymerase sigma-70 factor (ECF subfamily)
MTGASARPADDEAGREIAAAIPEPRSSGEPSPEPFRAFYEREYRGLVALAASLIGDRYMAEDIAQDALFVACRRWDHVGGLDSPLCWVRRVVANKSVSLIRRRLAELRALTRIGSLADRRPDSPESDEDFWALVRSLPRRQAQVIALHYVSDMSVVEIAATLGCKEGSVKASLFKARQHLLKSFGTSSGEIRAVGKPVTH